MQTTITRPGTRERLRPHRQRGGFVQKSIVRRVPDFQERSLTKHAQPAVLESGYVGGSELEATGPGPMRRIVIVGSGGAGKSTLARQLGAIFDIEVSHLDTLFWKPGWVEPSHVQWRKLMEQLVQGESWILEGNYGATFELRFAAADTIIFLDFPRVICLWRAFKRRFQYHERFRPDRAPGCREKLDFNFLKWIWAYPATRRPSVVERIQKHSAGKRVIVLHSPLEVKMLLKQLAYEGVRQMG